MATSCFSAGAISVFSTSSFFIFFAFLETFPKRSRRSLGFLLASFTRRDRDDGEVVEEDDEEEDEEEDEAKEEEAEEEEDKEDDCKNLSRLPETQGTKLADVMCSAAIKGKEDAPAPMSFAQARTSCIAVVVKCCGS